MDEHSSRYEELLRLTSLAAYLLSPKEHVPFGLNERTLYTSSVTLIG